jgi:hypothetical protein
MLLLLRGIDFGLLLFMLLFRDHLVLNTTTKVTLRQVDGWAVRATYIFRREVFFKHDFLFKKLFGSLMALKSIKAAFIRFKDRHQHDRLRQDRQLDGLLQ